MSAVLRDMCNDTHHKLRMVSVLVCGLALSSTVFWTEDGFVSKIPTTRPIETICYLSDVHKIVPALSISSASMSRRAPQRIRSQVPDMRLADSCCSLADD